MNKCSDCWFSPGEYYPCSRHDNDNIFKPKLKRLIEVLEDYEFHPNSKVGQSISHCKEVLGIK